MEATVEMTGAVRHAGRLETYGLAYASGIIWLSIAAILLGTQQQFSFTPAYDFLLAFPPFAAAATMLLADPRGRWSTYPLRVLLQHSRRQVAVEHLPAVLPHGADHRLRQSADPTRRVEQAAPWQVQRCRAVERVGPLAAVARSFRRVWAHFLPVFVVVCLLWGLRFLLNAHLPLVYPHWPVALLLITAVANMLTLPG
jgi:hypothetical protein